MDADVAISGCFCYVGENELPIQPKQVIDVSGKYLIPGHENCHMHIESTMSAPRTFMHGAVRNGVTTLIAEPHEIANVFGLEGIRAMLRTTQEGPCEVFIAIPSSVPSTNEQLETTGGIIDNDAVEALMHTDHVICLGEVMNCHDLIQHPEGKTSRLIRQIRYGCPYFPLRTAAGFEGWELAQILMSGVNSDHTDQSLSGLKQRIENGMFVQLQDKTLKPEFLQYLKENQLFEHFALVTDDTMPDAFMKRGQLKITWSRKRCTSASRPSKRSMYRLLPRHGAWDFATRAASLQGRLQILSFFPMCVNLRSKAPGAREIVSTKRAIHGRKKNGTPPSLKKFYHSVHVSAKKRIRFHLKSSDRRRERDLSHSGVQPHTTFVKGKQAELPVHHGEVDWEHSPYNLAVVFERHGKNGGHGLALVGGCAMKEGAAATTYAHDHHNLLVIERA